MNTKKHQREMAHIGSIIDQVLKTCRRDADGELIRVWHVWKDVVGDAVAENARPAAFKGRILLIHVTGSTWIHHLQFSKAEMIAKLNVALEKSLIDDLKFKIGPL